MRQAVEDYRELGLVPFPVCRPLGQGCIQHGKCTRPGKVPLVGAWQKIRNNPSHNASVDRKLVEFQYQVNLGLVCGVAGDLIVLDIDGTEGTSALDGWELMNGPVVRTGRIGGWHRWYRASGLVMARKIALLPHVDLLAEASFVLAPPSLHVSGNEYGHVGESLWSGEWPMLPEWIEKLAHQARPTSNHSALPAIDSDVGIGLRTREFLSNGASSAQREELVHAVTNLLGRKMAADEVFERVWFAISELSPTLNPSDPWTEAQVHKLVDEFERNGVRAAQALSAPSMLMDEPPVTSESRVVLNLAEWQASRVTNDSLPLIRGILDSGKTHWLWGQSGTGKTLISLDMGFSIASGRSYHGRETQKAGVLLIERDATNQLDDYLDLVLDAGDYDRDEVFKNFYIAEDESLHVKDKTGVRAMLTTIDSVPDCKLVIIDAFVAVANMGAAWSDQPTYLRMLKEGLEKRGIAMLMIDHAVGQALKKDANGESRNTLDTLMGGSLKQSVFDVGMFVHGDLKEDGLTLVWANKRGGARDNLKITFTADHGFTVGHGLVGDQVFKKLSDSENALVVLLSAKGEMLLSQAQETLGFNSRKMARALNDGLLADRGLVIRSGSGGRGRPVSVKLSNSYMSLKPRSEPVMDMAG